MSKSKKILALALAATMVFSVAVSAASFPDVDETTPEGIAIAKLSEMGVLGGFEDGTFGPEKTVTRAQFAKIVYMLENQGTTDPNADAFKGESVFTDVAADKWFAGFVNWANKEGIVGGMGDGTFAPDATLTMGQAIKMYVTSKGTSAEGVEYPQGFIDIATEAGFLANVAEFAANDAAPRGTIALVGFNTLSDAPVVAEPAADGTYTAVITSIEDGNIDFAAADAIGRPTIIKSVEDRPSPTADPKGVKTVFGADVNTLVCADPTAAKVTIVDGAMGSDAKGTEGKLADLKESTPENFYSATIVVKGGKVETITAYTTPAAGEVYTKYDKILALPSDYYVYHNPGATSVISLYDRMLANPADVPFTITAIDQPTGGAKVDFSENAKKFWRLQFTQPADSEVGDVVYFTYTITTEDGATKALGTVKANICEPTKVTDFDITVHTSESYMIPVEELYAHVKYTAGEPNGVPSFLIYDEANKKVVPVGTAFDTVGGAAVTRAAGDIVTYNAPAKAGTDKFVMSFNDGYGDVLCNVNVTIID